MDGSPAAPRHDGPSAEQLILYQTVAARRLAIDSLVWQAPGLAVAAQAFLMTLGLGPNSGRLARLAAGVLSAVVSLMAIQLILRHRRSESADALWLQRFEQEAGWPTIHAALTERLARAGIPNAGLASARATVLWVAGLAAFGVVGLAVGVRALWG